VSISDIYAAFADAYSEEESSMTLQVGLRGRDGIVIVSDSQVNSDVPDRYRDKEFHIHNTETREKIKVSSLGNIAVTCAMDMRQAAWLADAIIRQFSETNTPIDDQLRAIASTEMEKPAWRDMECLIAISKPVPTLFLMQCIKGKNGERDLCEVSGIPFYGFAGNRFLSPTFWVHRFYDESSNLPHTTSLLQLGAQVVLDAGHISRLSVNGLEAVRCDEHGISKLDTKEIGELITAIKKRNKRLQKEFSG
jgi:hypothetical protein